MRTNARLWTATLTALGAALLAVPAVAAQPDPFAEGDELIVPDVEVSEDSQETKPAGPRPPFHPLIGKPDYGDSEARFGASRSGHTHAGQDVFAEPGTPLVAPTAGVVVEQGTDGARGNHLAIYDPRRDRTYVYMHMIEPAQVELRDHVHAGQRVGGVGCTGSCWGDHLHFEIRDGRDIMGEATDPMPVIRDWSALKHPRG